MRKKKREKEREINFSSTYNSFDCFRQNNQYSYNRKYRSILLIRDSGEKRMLKKVRHQFQCEFIYIFIYINI